MEKNITDIQLSENIRQYWDARYQNNETGWDMKEVSPPIKDYIDSLQNKQIKILIPGCGNAYEAEYLLQKGFKNISLIDISKTLTDSLKEKFKNKKIKIYNENFFNHYDHYDLILEQTFFCALNPGLRKEYVNQCEQLLSDKGKIAGVLFNIKMEKPGPPYSGTDKEYKELFSPKFDINIFEPCTNSIKPRLGSELFFAFQKKKQ